MITVDVALKGNAQIPIRNPLIEINYVINKPATVVTQVNQIGFLKHANSPYSKQRLIFKSIHPVNKVLMSNTEATGFQIHIT